MLELLMILAIAGLMFMMGIRAYQSYQTSFQIAQLRANVDQLFNAMSNYYRANCQNGDFASQPRDLLSPYPSSTTGLSYPPAGYYPISLTGLVTLGYLEQWYPNNALVDPTGGTSGYIIQFNPVVTTGVTVGACVVMNRGVRCNVITPSSAIPASQAKLVTWSMQVAVKIKDTTKINGYMAALGADCTSGISTTAGAVDSCPSSNAIKNYVVWMRIPSYGAIQKPNALNAPMQYLRAFSRQYTHDANYEFNNGYSTTTTPAQAPVYYSCGG